MRVLFLDNFYYLRGGSERVMFDEMRMVSGAGHEVAAFSRANTRNEKSAYDRYYPNDIDTDSQHISLRALKIVKEIIYSGDTKKALMQLIDAFQPDIAHAHNIYGRLSLSVIDALKEAGIPTILTLHDYKLLCPSYLMLDHGKICERCKGGKFRHAVLRKCHKNSYAASAIYAFESWFNHCFGKYESVKTFISPSQFLRAKAVEFGWGAERVAFIPNFIDCKQICPGTVPGGYFLYLGRLSREKGVNNLLQAYSRLSGAIPLMVAGDGPERAALEPQVNTHQITFAGHLKGEQIEKAIAGARAVVIPSEWYENAPLSILEAFAHGKPVIGSRIGGIPEMIDDGVNGFLFEPGNVEELRSKLALVSSLPDSKIREMGMAARAKAEKEYSPELHYERLVAVYEKAIRDNTKLGSRIAKR